MKKRIHFQRPALVLALACIAALPSVAAADVETLRVLLGTQRRVALPADVTRIAVGDPAVTRVQLLTSRELLALGRSVGSTNVLLWSTGGRVDELRIRVTRDLSVLQQALSEIHPEIRVRAAPDRDAVILRGVVPEVRYANAAEDLAYEYLGESSRGEVLVGAAGDAEVESLSDPATDEQIYLVGDPERSATSVINLIRVEGLPPSLESRIEAAIGSLGGRHVRVRRLARGVIPSDEDDTFVLEGEVHGQVALVRVLLAAARLVDGDRARAESVEVLANEAGSLTQSGSEAGSPLSGLSSIGGFASNAGSSVRAARVGNELSANIARAKALSAAGGRLLAFIDVIDVPQVRLETRIYEISRSRLRDWRPEFSVLVGDLDNAALIPGPTSRLMQGNAASPLTATEIQGALSLLEGGAVASGVQYISDHVAIDATFRLLEDANVARALARPTLTVLSGELARFNAGGQIPISVTVDTQTSAAAGTLLSSTVFASFGVDIAVRPLVEEDDTITLDIAPSISQPDFDLTADITRATGTAQETTAFETRSLKTTTRLRDGQSFMIAGFLQSSLSDDWRFTPGLHRIPLLGWLAKSQVAQRDDTDFVIVISPAIVREPTPRGALWEFPDSMDLLNPLLEPVPLPDPVEVGTR